MIKPILKFSDIRYDEWGEDPDDFYVCLDAFIGEEDKEGSEVFTFDIASPRRLLKDLNHSVEIEVGRGYLITSDYNLPRIEAKITQLLKNCERENWDLAINAISRYGRWEDES